MNNPLYCNIESKNPSHVVVINSRESVIRMNQLTEYHKSNQVQT